jgi:hypothetical protein
LQSSADAEFLKSFPKYGGVEVRSLECGSSAVFFGGVGVFLHVWLADPYDSGGLTYMSDDEADHVFGMMIVPPLFLGALWFGYKRFVE